MMVVSAIMRIFPSNSADVGVIPFCFTQHETDNSTSVDYSMYDSYEPLLFSETETYSLNNVVWFPYEWLL